jgi:hypothetical protein
MPPASAQLNTSASKRAKYIHQRAAASAKPRIAVSTEPTAQSARAVPRETAMTDSPRTMSVKRPKRSGMCERWRGTSPPRR